MAKAQLDRPTDSPVGTLHLYGRVVAGPFCIPRTAVPKNLPKKLCATPVASE
jgi:hypothetical protein